MSAGVVARQAGVRSRRAWVVVILLAIVSVRFVGMHSGWDANKGDFYTRRCPGPTPSS